MRRPTTGVILTVLGIISCLLGTLGCQLLGDGSARPGPFAAATAADPAGSGWAGAASVRFEVRLDQASPGHPATGEARAATPPMATLRATPGATVRFELVTIRPGDAQTPTISRATDVVAVTETVSATFDHVPVAPTLARVTVTGGTVENATAFRGALDLLTGNNTVVVNPVGSRLSRDLLAAAVEAVVANPSVLAGLAPDSRLVTRLETLVAGLDRNAADLYHQLGDLALQHAVIPASTLANAAALRLSVAIASPTLASYRRGNGPLRGGAVDASGNVWFVDFHRSVLLRMAPGGDLTIVAGTPDQPGDADDPGDQRYLPNPRDVTLDADGNLVVIDPYRRIRKVTRTGAIAWFSGAPYNVSFVGVQDGPALTAVFNVPTALALLPGGDLVVAEESAGLIRRVTPTGAVTTIGGAFNEIRHADGTGAQSRFLGPADLAADRSGRTLIADHHCIRRIETDGMVTTLTGSPQEQGIVDGTGPAARFNRLTRIVADADGNALVIDSASNGPQLLRLVTAAGAVRTLAGNLDPYATWRDGTGANAVLAEVQDCWLDAAGHLRLLEAWFDGANPYLFVREGTPETGPSLPDRKLAIVAIAGRAPAPVDLRPMLQNSSPPKVYVALAENDTFKRIPLRALTADDFDEKGVVAARVTLSGALRARAVAGELTVEIGDEKGPVLLRTVKAALAASASADGAVPVQMDAISTAKGLVYAQARRTNAAAFADIDDFDQKAPVASARSIFPNADAQSSLERVWQSTAKYLLNAQINQTETYRANATALTTRVETDVFVGKYGNPTTSAQPDAFGIDDLTIGDYLAGGANAPTVYRLNVATVAVDILRDAPGYAGNHVAVDGNGNVFVTFRYSVNRVGNDGVVTRVAGTADYEGAATPFTYLTSIVHDGAGGFYLLDGSRIHRMAANYTLTDAGLWFPVQTLELAMGSDGQLYGVGLSAVMRAVPPPETTGALVAGSWDSSAVGTVDGTGSNARFGQALDTLAIDSAGQLFVGDSWNHCIRKVTPDGVVTTWVGHLGLEAPPGFDPGPAPWNRTALYPYQPKVLAVDAADGLFYTSLSGIYRCGADGDVFPVMLTLSDGSRCPPGFVPSQILRHPDGSLLTMAVVGGTTNLYRLTTP